MKHVSLVKNARLIGQLCLYLFLPFLAYEQNAKAISLLVAPRPQQVNLFLHLDKSIYQPGETVWFTGYILNRDEDLMREQNTLYALLVDPISQKPVANQRFLIKNGFGKGYLTLPDTLVAGDYWIIGYTNALLETGDQPVFRQLISLRTGTPSPFRISSATLEPDGDSLRVRYKIITSYKGLASGGRFAYTLFDSTNTLASGEKTIDAFGEVTIAVGAKSDAGKPREITATITRNGLSNGFMLPVYTGRPTQPEAATQSNARQTQANAPQAQSFAVSIEPDSAGYHQRSIVTLHIRIRDSSDRPLPAIFSLAVVASKKIDTTRTRSILQYDESPEPTSAPPPVVGQLKTLAGDKPDYGYVLLDNNTPNKPVSLALMGNGFSSLQTDAAGKFELPYSLLVAPAGSTNYVSVADKSAERYKIAVYSRADTFNRQLAAIHYPLKGNNPATTQDPDETAPQAPGTLKTAVVKATMMTENREFGGVYNSTHCDQDYVCTHNHGGPMLPDDLNCAWVERKPCVTVKPVEGGRYLYTPREAAFQQHSYAAFVIYHCAAPTTPPFMKLLQPILPGKPFPLQDYSGHDAQGPAMRSTVYWNHSLYTNDKGEATISFYTNDLPGNFTCILQGVSTAGVVTGKGTYTVSPETPMVSTASRNE